MTATPQHSPGLMCGEGEHRDGIRPAGPVSRIFLLTAMAEEAAALGKDLGSRTWVRAAGARFAVGSGPYSAVAVGISGMGKVAAAIAVQYACARWRPWLVLMSGVVGGVRPDARVGDLVVPSQAIQHDYDARPFAAARSLIPHLGTAALEPDHRVSSIAAVAQVARQTGLAWAAVRMISDTADDVDAEAVLEYLASSGAKALSSILRETIDQILDREPQLSSHPT